MLYAECGLSTAKKIKNTGVPGVSFDFSTRDTIIKRGKKIMYQFLDYFYYILLDGLFYRNIEDYAPEHSEFYNFIKENLPDGWKMEKNGLWFYAFPENIQLPLQGWKIHISARQNNALDILKDTSSILFKEGVSFKFNLDRFIFSLMNSKNWHRGGAGKFITVYPENTEQFKSIIERLYQKLRHYEGPYILSDARYKDARVIYYRYGGFVPRTILTVEGYHIPIINDPEGRPVPDIRNPFYTPPSWVKDPFGKEPRRYKDILLKNRYKVLSPITYNNTGGIYLATDTFTDSRVVIKEARAFIDVDEAGLTAQDVLKKEYEILKEIEHSHIAPRALDLFKEWEHLFLVEELIEGQDLREFVVVNSPLLKINPGIDDFEKYLENFKKIFVDLINSIKTLHQHGIVFRDLSHNNILVLKDLTVKLIDFESAYVKGDKQWLYILTPGFASKEALEGKEPSEYDDYYAIAQNMIAYLFPLNAFFDICPLCRETYVEELLKDLYFPKEIKNIINALSDKNSGYTIDDIVGKIKTLNPVKYHKTKSKDPDIKKVVEKLGAFLEKHSKDKGNFIFPPSPLGLSTNTISLAYGDTGVLYSLSYSKLKINKSHIEKTIKRVKEEIDGLPPGFMNGLAGIGYVLYKLGFKEDGIDLCLKSTNHPLLYNSPDLFQGSAGVSHVLFQLFLETNDEGFLNQSLEILNSTFKKLENSEEGLYFINADNDIHYGLMHGSSSIAYVAMEIYNKVKDPVFRKHAKRLLEFDLSKRVEIEKGVYSFPPSQNNNNTVLPYLRYGTAGVVTTLLEFYRAEEERDFAAEWINMLISDLKRKYTIFPGYFNGMAGIIDTLISVYQTMHVQEVKKAINRAVEGLLLYLVDNKDDAFFPSDGLFRTSADLGTGISGIMNVLYRFSEMETEKSPLFTGGIHEEA